MIYKHNISIYITLTKLLQIHQALWAHSQDMRFWELEGFAMCKDFHVQVLSVKQPPKRYSIYV